MSDFVHVKTKDFFSYVQFHEICDDAFLEKMSDKFISGVSEEETFNWVKDATAFDTSDFAIIKAMAYKMWETVNEHCSEKKKPKILDGCKEFLHKNCEYIMQIPSPNVGHFAMQQDLLQMLWIHFDTYKDMPSNCGVSTFSDFAKTYYDNKSIYHEGLKKVADKTRSFSPGMECFMLLTALNLTEQGHTLEDSLVKGAILTEQIKNPSHLNDFIALMGQAYLLGIPTPFITYLTEWLETNNLLGEAELSPETANIPHVLHESLASGHYNDVIAHFKSGEPLHRFIETDVFWNSFTGIFDNFEYRRDEMKDYLKSAMEYFDIEDKEGNLDFVLSGGKELIKFFYKWLCCEPANKKLESINLESWVLAYAPLDVVKQAAECGIMDAAFVTNHNYSALQMKYLLSIYEKNPDIGKLVDDPFVNIEELGFLTDCLSKFDKDNPVFDYVKQICSGHGISSSYGWIVKDQIAKGKDFEVLLERNSRDTPADSDAALQLIKMAKVDKNIAKLCKDFDGFLLTSMNARIDAGLSIKEVYDKTLSLMDEYLEDKPSDENHKKYAEHYAGHHLYDKKTLSEIKRSLKPTECEEESETEVELDEDL